MNSSANSYNKSIKSKVRSALLKDLNSLKETHSKIQAIGYVVPIESNFPMMMLACCIPCGQDPYIARQTSRAGTRTQIFSAHCEVLLAGSRVQFLPAHSCISVTFALPKMALTNR